jgi:hypothetical protein
LGFGFEIFNFGRGLFPGGGNGGFGRFLPLMLGICQVLLSILSGQFGLLGRVGFCLFYNLSGLCFSLFYLLYQFHFSHLD